VVRRCALLKTLPPAAAGGVALSNVTLVKAAQLLKTKLPRFVTDAGRVIDVKPVLLKVLLPMCVSEVGRVIVVMPEPLNTALPMLVMPLCSVTDVRSVQSAKRFWARLVIPAGIVIDVKPVFQKTSLPRVVRLLGRLIDVKPEFAKALKPIVVIPSGRVIDVKPAHPEKAVLPILVIPSGIMIDVKAVF
jgi:hypothetical protein